MAVQHKLWIAALRAGWLAWLAVPAVRSVRLQQGNCLLQRATHLAPGSFEDHGVAARAAQRQNSSERGAADCRSQGDCSRTLKVAVRSARASDRALAEAAQPPTSAAREGAPAMLFNEPEEADTSALVSWHASFLSLSEEMQWHGDIFGHPKERLRMGNEGMHFFRTASREDWSILFVTIVALMMIDFFWLRHATGGTTRMNVCVLGIWISIGVAFNALVWARKGREAGIMWCSGYFLEWILSMDNLFVFHLVFRVYATPKELLHKALFLGIIGAAVFRMCFFMALASLLDLVHWFRFIFGGLLIWSGIQAAREDEDEVDVQNLTPVRWLNRCLGSRLTESYDTKEKSVFITKDGKIQATLLLPVIFCLEMTDILFAVDSVSAKVAQIPNYYLAYSSSVIAIFGLRAMFFILRDMVDFFDLLKYGLCFILVFIGVELMLEDYVKLPAQVVCVVILSVFLVCISGSTAQSLYNKRAANRR